MPLMAKQKKGGKMKGYKKHGVEIFTLLFLVVGCGRGGDDGPKPLGLFDDQNGNQTNANLSTDPLTAGDMLIISDQELGAHSLGIETAAATGKSLVSKNYNTKTGENCVNVDSTNVACSDVQIGPVQGDVKTSASIHYEEQSPVRKKGNIVFRSEYRDFTFSQNICKRDVQIKGAFRCDIDFEYRGEQDGVAIDISGLCNTAAASDHTMQIWFGGKEHRVGYDLALSLNSKITSATSQQFFLKDMKIDGTVSFDGVAYPYDAVKSIIKIQCNR